MWLRISRHYDLHEIEGKMLAYYYRHEGQITGSKIKVYEGLVTLFKKIFHTYENVPKALYIRKIAMNQYTLGRVYYKEGIYQKAWKNASEAVMWYPWVGLLFINKSDNVAVKPLKLIKPYIFLIICAFRLLGSIAAGSANSPTQRTK
jgi:hypothetical protein